MYLFQNPPNILVQAELRSYVTPVVILPQIPQDEPDGSQVSGDLIDVSSESSQNCSRSMSPDLLAQRYLYLEFVSYFLIIILVFFKKYIRILFYN